MSRWLQTSGGQRLQLERSTGTCPIPQTGQVPVLRSQRISFSSPLLVCFPGFGSGVSHAGQGASAAAGLRYFAWQRHIMQHVGLYIAQSLPHHMLTASNGGFRMDLPPCFHLAPQFFTQLLPTFFQSVVHDLLLSWFSLSSHVHILLDISLQHNDVYPGLC